MDLIWQIHYGVATVPESSIGALRCSIDFLSEKEDPRQEDCHPPRHTTGVPVCHCFMSLLPEKTVEKSTEKRGGFHSENVGLVDGRVFLARACTQLEEYLFSLHEALGSNLNITQNQNSLEQSTLSYQLLGDRDSTVRCSGSSQSAKAMWEAVLEGGRHPWIRNFRNLGLRRCLFLFNAKPKILPTLGTLQPPITSSPGYLAPSSSL